jgi:ABC-type sulfate transport system substrate-binding protein
MLRHWLLSISAAMILGVAPIHAGETALTLLNASYDPTRELYQELNAAFAQAWKGRTGQVVAMHQSHGGSGKQARQEWYRQLKLRKGAEVFVNVKHMRVFPQSSGCPLRPQKSG